MEKEKFAIQDAICDKLADIADMAVAESAVMETGKSKYVDQLIRLQSQVLGNIWLSWLGAFLVL